MLDKLIKLDLIKKNGYINYGCNMNIAMIDFPEMVISVGAFSKLVHASGRCRSW